MLAQWVADLARAEELGPDLAYRLDLCLAEVVSNVVLHGLAGEGREPIRVSVWRDTTHLWVSVVDDGPPFDPLAHPLPPPPQRLEDLETRGFGIPIVRNLADQLEYARRAGVNNLTLAFRPH